MEKGQENSLMSRNILNILNFQKTETECFYEKQQRNPFNFSIKQILNFFIKRIPFSKFSLENIN